MSKVGLHFHGLLSDYENHRFSTLDTPDGHRYGRPIFVKELLSRGHEVFCLQKNRDEINYPGVIFVEDEFPQLDFIFMEYRWSTWKNDKTHPDHNQLRYEPDLDRQTQILQKYHDDIPIIMWDTDLKINKEFELKWPKLILAEPSLYPRFYSRSRTTIPFWTDFKQLISTSTPYRIYGLVGNNYERDEEFEKFYFSVSKLLRVEGIQTSMYGNWLQESPERKSVSSMIKNNDSVAFNHRMNFYDSLQIMNKFICTTHCSKQEYYERSFISPRYFEALAVNCPAFVPTSHLCYFLGKQYSVSSASDVFSLAKQLSLLTVEQRNEVVEEQRNYLKSNNDFFNVKNIVNLVEFLCKV